MFVSVQLGVLFNQTTIENLSIPNCISNKRPSGLDILLAMSQCQKPEMHGMTFD